LFLLPQWLNENSTGINTWYIFLLRFLSQEEPARAMFLYTFYFIFQILFYYFKKLTTALEKKGKKTGKEKFRYTVSRYAITRCAFRRFTSNRFINQHL